MENQKDGPSSPNIWTNIPAKEKHNDLSDIPYTNDRLGQSFFTLSPSQKRVLMKMSEKELNQRSREEAIRAIMERSGKTREEVEKMLAEQF